MVAKFHITCTTPERIGGVDPHGKPWQLTRKEALAGVKRGEWQFIVLINGAVQDVDLDRLPPLPVCP